MSNKPEKKGDARQRLRKADAKMKKRKKAVIGTLPPFMYIVTEGTVTEVTYIEGFAKNINMRYGAFSTRDRIVVKGFGKSCLTLLEEAERTVGKVCPKAKVVWLVYDKDDFPKDSFDNTQFSAESRRDTRKYRVAWSNESIELWFLLHFQDMKSEVSRKQYIKLLEAYCDYRKNDPELFEKLYPRTEEAINRADKLFHSYEKNTAPSAMCPATRMHELVKDLMGYMRK